VGAALTVLAIIGAIAGLVGATAGLVRALRSKKNKSKDGKPPS
jgi:hypothetical protein